MNFMPSTLSLSCLWLVIGRKDLCATRRPRIKLVQAEIDRKVPTKTDTYYAKPQTTTVLTCKMHTQAEKFCQLDEFTAALDSVGILQLMKQLLRHNSKFCF